MGLYIISEDSFLVLGLNSTFQFNVFFVHNLKPAEALDIKYTPQSLLIIDTRMNLDKKFYALLSKKDVAVIFFISGNPAVFPRFVYADNSIHHKTFSIKNNPSTFLFDKLRVVFKQCKFTAKERMLLIFIFEGKSISDFCRKHKIKKSTYDTHAGNILLKVGGCRICFLYKFKQMILYDIMRTSFSLKSEMVN
ncbi:hypothetical protein [Klebsiella pneumoniae]|uniref:hypothetical protein n=1 Tax=Klebsiella pneumoniae TaxID=573 RepID=UPI0035A2272E|nr:hypothetical protein [Klebsiella pneumoniae]HCF8380779.1 hypothetical protein [Klebsiella pneumoniae]